MKLLTAGAALATALACAGVSSGSESLVQLLERANQANVRHDVSGEARLLRRAVAADGPQRERARARRDLARNRWKFHHDFDEASELLSQAVEVGAEKAKAWAQRAEMETARRNYSSAIESGRRAIATAGPALERRLAVMAFSRAVIAAATQERLEGRDVDEELLGEALEVQRDLTRLQAGDHDAAGALLTLAVLTDSPEDVVEAWRAYYFVTDEDPGPALVVEPGRRVRELYSRWSPAAPASDRIALVRALTDSRFYLEGALVALDPDAIGREEVLGDPRVAEIVAYAQFCRTVRAASDEFYRRSSLDRGNADRWQAQLAAAAAELWSALDNPASSPPSRRGSSLNSAIRGELATRFGSYGSLRNSGGYPSLHFGHVTERETRRVEQYGHSGSLTHIVIDNMVSNGFQTWAWNSAMEAGGWATSSGMISIRPGLLREVVAIWNTYESPEERAVVEERIGRETPLDDERARGGVVHLPGLDSRIALQNLEQVSAIVRDKGVADDEFRLAAIKELRRLQQESAIFAHEGRHAIDLQLNPSQGAAELEFTAKLSQVAFSPVPRIGLFGILGPNLGDRTPHGQANLRFAEGAIAWMKAHQDEIEGFDPSRPHFPQLDLLTDDQLVQMVRWMDPLVSDSLVPAENSSGKARLN